MEPGPQEFEEVLCYTDWWDCPRSGVALLHGRPHYFLCEFSEQLDDYPGEYQVWPIDPETLERELAAWAIFVAWRKDVDSGAAVRPLEENEEFAALSMTLRDERLAPTGEAIVAVPTWRLDLDRTFKKGSPRHMVAWTVVQPPS